VNREIEFDSNGKSSESCLAFTSSELLFHNTRYVVAVKLLDQICQEFTL
jgi:hypothetical protein